MTESQINAALKGVPAVKVRWHERPDRSNKTQILTQVLNGDKIALELGRKYFDLMQFWQHALNTFQTKHNGVVVFTAKIAAETIQQHLRDFVEYYVLCRKCGSSDTVFALDLWKKQVLRLKCKTCGKKKSIKEGNHILDEQIVFNLRHSQDNEERLAKERKKENEKLLTKAYKNIDRNAEKRLKRKAKREKKLQALVASHSIGSFA